MSETSIYSELMSIKDFSELTGIKQSTLRYFDDIGLFTPAARGENGYRYYSPVQTITINSIKLLHELDMPIKMVSELEKNRDPELLLKVLTEKNDELESAFIKLQKSLNVVKTLKRNIQVGLAADETVIETRFLEEQPISIGQENDFRGSEMFYDAFIDFILKAKQYKIDLRLPVGGVFNTFESFADQPGKPNNFFSVDPGGLDKQIAGVYLVGYARGYYGETGNLVARMQEYIKKNDIKTIGHVYGLYLHDELSIRDIHEYLFQAKVLVDQS